MNTNKCKVTSEKNSEIEGNCIKSNLIIPAYTNNGKGIYTQLFLEATKSENLKIISIGAVAQSLEKLLLRNIEILAALKPSFAALVNFQYKLTSEDVRYQVKDVRSASLPICLTLLNLLRGTWGKNQINSIIGTGILRSDGSFDASAFENIKEKAINQGFSNNKKFINSENCNHVFDLEILLNGC